MPSPPSPRTWIDNEIPAYDTVNQEVYDTLSFLLQPPMLRMRQTSGQSIPDSTVTALTWQTEDVDPYSWHNPSVNPTRITPTYPGWYRGWYSVGWPGTGGGSFRLGYIRKNASTTDLRARHDSRPTSNGYTKRFAGVPFFIPMNGTTDYFEIMVLQDTGAAMTTNSTANIQSELFLRYWAPL